MNRSEGNVREASAAGAADERTDGATSISASEASEAAPNTSTFRTSAPATSDSAFGASKRAPSDRPSRPGSRVRFDPAAVARHEKAGWEAYYDRRWGRAFAHIALLNRAQFGMGWPTALAGALDIVRASVAFKPLVHDLDAVQVHLERFYARARIPLGCRADAETLATLELDYWVVHRNLAIARMADTDETPPGDRRVAPPIAEEIEPMVASLATLHAALFDLPEADMRPSAEHRAWAAVAVDRITSRQTTDIAEDWRIVTHELESAYRAVKSVIDRAPGTV